MRNFWFSLKEGVLGFKRARLASVITITSLALALLLAGYFILFSININHWIGEKRSQMELEVFFENDLSNAKAKEATAKIQQIPGAAKVVYISKKAAAARFEKEFGRNIYDILDSNPLPPSCTVRLKTGYQTSAAVQKMVLQIGRVNGVSDVVYEKELLRLIDYYVTWIYIILGGFGVILLLIAVILLYNTIRLTLFARRDIIEIMGLTGATASFIKRPFIIEGFLQGLLGALAASGLLYLSVRAIRRLLFGALMMQDTVYFLLIAAGILIGMISSALSLSRYLDKI